KNVDAQACPELEDALDRFYTQLEDVLEPSILLAELPKKYQPEMITVDGTSYTLQIWTGERTLAIYPDRDVDLELDGGSGALLSVVSRCSNGLPSTIEEHYRW